MMYIIGFKVFYLYMSYISFYFGINIVLCLRWVKFIFEFVMVVYREFKLMIMFVGKEDFY